MTSSARKPGVIDTICIDDEEKSTIETLNVIGMVTMPLSRPEKAQTHFINDWFHLICI